MADPTPPTAPPRLVPLVDGATHADRHPRTVRRWLELGYIQGYRRRGQRGLLVDLDEIDSLASRFPRTKVRPSFGRLGPDAKPIVQLPALAVVVPTPPRYTGSGARIDRIGPTS